MITRRLLVSAGLIAAAGAVVPGTLQAADPPARHPLVGRWDLVVKTPEGATYPSWLDVQLSGRSTLVGYFVGRGGSVRPVSRVHVDGDKFNFTLPVQWETPDRDFVFEGRIQDGKLVGTQVTNEGKKHEWTAVRAPALRPTGTPQWGQPIELFNGKDLTGWKTRHASRPNGWKVEDGLLRNAKPGNDLITTQDFTDFKLHAEFRYPAGSNSGIYLRGRYEAQIEDNYGRPPESHLLGGIYGFVSPRVNAARPAGEWQTYDLTLVGRYVTIVLNGEEVVTRQEIPGITGGALDSNEGLPGPLMLQGDHGPVDFRKLTLTPAR